MQPRTASHSQISGCLKPKNLVKYVGQNNYLSSGKVQQNTNRKTAPDLMGTELRNKSALNLSSVEFFLRKNCESGKLVAVHNVP